MAESISPTERELDILKVLWDRREATVRDVHEVLSTRLPIVQNTVQAFLRIMEEKGLVRHRTDGRTFIYQPIFERQHLARHVLQKAFDGAMDQFVQSVLELRKPTSDEIARLEALLAEAKSGKTKPAKKEAQP
jgi:predicted transcriptional regulator